MKRKNLYLVFLSLMLIPLRGMTQSDGTCAHPYKITDSVFVLQSTNLQTEKVWFAFTAQRNAMYIQFVDENNTPYNYLIFRYTDGNFCDAITQKQLVPERNKVCDKDITYDAATSLSYENINRGVCKCPSCCSAPILLHTIPGSTYYVVVYNPRQSIRFEAGATTHNTPVTNTQAKDNVPEKESKKLSADININNINVGDHIELENIYFEPGLAVFLSISYDALDVLLAFLKNNPSVKIEIQGHVNGPGIPPDINYSNNLGLRRARAVFDFLIARKIDKERLSCKGYGNTRMIYPEARSEAQMARNRRVEIVIISK